MAIRLLIPRYSDFPIRLPFEYEYIIKDDRLFSGDAINVYVYRPKGVEYSKLFYVSSSKLFVSMFARRINMLALDIRPDPILEKVTGEYYLIPPIADEARIIKTENIEGFSAKFIVTKSINRKFIHGELLVEDLGMTVRLFSIVDKKFYEAHAPRRIP